MRSLLRLAGWRLGLVAIDSWASPAEVECLARHATRKKRLAEIGVWEGGTTRVLRRVMHEEGVLYAIDPFPTGRLGLSYQRPIARGEVARVRNGRVVWMRDTGADAAFHPDVRSAPFDFVFIDGRHTYDGLRDDWVAWEPLLADTVALHDVVGDPQEGSVRFAEERIFTDARFEVVERVGCLAVIRRRGGAGPRT